MYITPSVYTFYLLLNALISLGTQEEMKALKASFLKGEFHPIRDTSNAKQKKTRCPLADVNGSPPTEEI